MNKILPKGLSCTALICLATAILTAETPERTISEVKQQIRKHIASKTGKLPAGTAIPKGNPYVWAWEQYHAVPKQDPKVLYNLVGEHLAIADARFLASKKAEERRKGLGMAYEACTCANHRLKDTWLAVAICEGYVLPNLDVADDLQWQYLSRQNMLEVMVDVYASAKDGPKMAAALKLVIDNAANRNTADAGRLRLAQVLDKLGRYEEAVKLLHEIDDKEGVGGAKKLIPIIEKKMKSK